MPPLPDPSRHGRPGFAALFAALPVAVIVIDPDDRIAHANALAEQLLNLSERLMVGQPLDAILPPPGEGSARDGHGFAIYDTEIATARGHKIRVDFVEAQVPDHAGWRAITLHSSATSRRLGHSADRAAGARAAVGAAAMLAHEIKNPLSGIRGAAQLIGAGELTTLITTEVDRIAALIDRMQDFSDTRPLPSAPENIYPLLAHARRVALAGFARGVMVEERYDPSLPPASVNRDALLQIVINLLKNAREAVHGTRNPRIVLTTAYRHGMAVSAAPGRPRLPLPIEICVIDNGPGAPADIADHLFDPFVSGRREGQGLGLALVDKLMRDMGGIVQYAREGSPEMTVLRLLLPRAGV
ncbi:two-component system sensor histidine kinase NtrB [Sphingomonas carotinifaciens]|uniref:histidine kinase n=1 Tax=Sphingomonas carotinifaciens TaxID=1166323 RepID=A0A1G7R3V5_9SPHN|nr:ATP-binding protein [Sphingomonas carotinifaciens]MBB4087927.1 two-component system nitrogen regulation sensor histidine kinase GlnL [Sphingomonas carotinifaciens]MWC44779.1 PAS domain-containing protein [Sphingomonas carotinifaciens]SDG05425.1 two-component system, NtrC family, nitrogen regulation sensor histidine kinase GlnL [Sphingomonas carotinifaciens]